MRDPAVEIQRRPTTAGIHANPWRIVRSPRIICAGDTITLQETHPSLVIDGDRRELP